MECKYTDVRGLGEAFSELIDTLWNVNEVVRIRCDLSTLELIDTLWNVNWIRWSQRFWCSPRINRYIMECKLKNSIGFPVAADELIDTLWNVNKYKIGQEERVSITN